MLREDVAGSATRPVGCPVGCLLPLSAGGVVAGATVWVVARIWDTCDVGVNGSANAGVPLFCSLAMWGVFSVLWGLVLTLLGGRGAGKAYAVAIIAGVVVAWGTIAWIGVLDSYPAPVCPGNVPSWWPGLLPVQLPGTVRRSARAAGRTV